MRDVTATFLTMIVLGSMISGAFAQVNPGSAASLARTQLDLNSGWRFGRTDPAAAMMPGFDDSAWRGLDLPHDWSIEGPFGPEYASATGYVPGGIAWYRKHLTLDPAHQGKLISIEFDGVYERSQVYVNGFVVGGRPYGYSSFSCDLTPYLRFGPDADNVIAVRVDHSRYGDSRWYTGSGIYRNVRLRMTERVSVDRDGVYITTPDVKDGSATVRVETSVSNRSGEARPLEVESQIIGPDGRPLGSARASATVSTDGSQTITQQIAVENPQRWSIESPALYTLRTRVVSAGRVVDEISTPFGIRTIQFDPDRGFLLNGKQVKLKGVCIHHDAGALGAAVPEKVLERRLRLLKELGVNAIRTSHNPPAPELLDLCDKLGLLVKDEAFDEFTPAKNKWIAGWNVGEPGRWGYADLFDQWAITDLQDMIRRDRNHPSIIIWSIGNEIDYANDPFSHPVLGNNYRPQHPPAQELVRLGKPLIDAVKKLDPTRPVSAGLANLPMSDAVGLPDLLDIVGYNYQESLYPADHQKHPRRVIFGSENGHQYANWAVVRDNEYVVGQFLWTGIDYLGEARAWPARGNTAGLLETTGFKKPQAWFRQSLWSDKPMVYVGTSTPAAPNRRGRGGRGGGAQLGESWNFSAGAEVLVTCYTNCQQVQLFVNDKPVATLRGEEAVNGVLTATIPFETGVLRAVGLNNAVPASEFTLRTAGSASRIELIPDQKQLRADGRDISHVEVRITDDKGVIVVDPAVELRFELEGPARLLGIDNGEHIGAVDYRSTTQQTRRGRAMAILQTTRQSGAITVRLSSPGLAPATLQLSSE